MKQKLLFYFTDEAIILFNSMGETLWVCKEDIKKSQAKLNHVLSSYSSSPLCFLIDRSQQDIREEKTPSLLPWDRARFLWYKKEEWKGQGGYFGYHFFKHEGDTYLRWVHIQQKDKLIDWILWAKSLSHPFTQVFFISHEARAFLERHVLSLEGYLMFLYSFPPAPIRQLVFQGERLLLSRSVQGKEDIQTSLHFLSRTFLIFMSTFILSLFSIKLPSRFLIVNLLLTNVPLSNFLLHKSIPTFL